jgi:hypothetical protein
MNALGWTAPLSPLRAQEWTRAPQPHAERTTEEVLYSLVTAKFLHN